VPLAIVIAAVLIASLVLFGALQSGYGWSERDWNSDGHTSIGEFFEAADIGSRPITQVGKSCVEYFSLKDGMPVRVDCPAPRGQSTEIHD
jgi:hypothetical protein